MECRGRLELEEISRREQRGSPLPKSRDLEASNIATFDRASAFEEPGSPGSRPVLPSHSHDAQTLGREPGEKLSSAPYDFLVLPG